MTVEIRRYSNRRNALSWGAVLRAQGIDSAVADRGPRAYKRYALLVAPADAERAHVLLGGAPTPADGALALDRHNADRQEFTETPRGYRARERWARRYDDLNGAPESDGDR